MLSTHELPDRVHPIYSSAFRSPLSSLVTRQGTEPRRRAAESSTSKLWSLTWPVPPRNILLVKKLHVPLVRSSLITFAK